eukprot:3972593-Pleurochrysis_carterae.AAC.2
MTTTGALKSAATSERVNFSEPPRSARISLAKGERQRYVALAAAGRTGEQRNARESADVREPVHLCATPCTVSPLALAQDDMMRRLQANVARAQVG